MALFDRFRRVIKANLNEMISKAEDPKKVLNQLITDMREQLVEIKKSVAIAIADEKRLQRELTKQQQSATEWETNAMKAVSADNDELAKKALVRKQEHDEYADGYQEQFDAQHASVEQLKGSLRQLQDKIDEAERKKNLLIARQQRADAQKRIQQTLGATKDTSAFAAFDRIEEKVNQAEAQAEAAADLAKLEGGDADLERQFKELETGSSDQMLKDLKAKMNKQLEDKTAD